VNHEELEQIVLAQGSRLAFLDEIIKSERLGEKKVVAFRCGHSGKFYPADFLKGWGRRYGIGLGPVPGSECWDSQYELGLPPLDSVRRQEQLAYPVVTTLAQVDMVVVPASEYLDSRLVLAHDDRDGERRAAIVLQNQLINQPRLRAMHAQFAERLG